MAKTLKKANQNRGPKAARPSRPAKGCSTTTIGSRSSANPLKTLEKTSTTTKSLKTLNFSTTTTLRS